MSTSPEHLQSVLERLSNSKRNGDSHIASCPAHSDTNPSLSITINDNGRVNLKCFAGCDSDSILRALRMNVADLYPSESRKQRGPKVLREYRYITADGEIAYVVQRRDTTKKNARFVMKHPTVNGLASGRGDVDRLLYRLPQILAEPGIPVVLCEGERDADTLAEACRLLATTVAHGSWADVDLSVLKNREVFVMIDNDAAGKKRGQAAAEAAQKAGGIIVEFWRPADAFKDATDMLRHPKYTCNDVITIDDIEAFEPIVNTWHTDVVEVEQRAVVDKHGVAINGRMPTPLMLSLLQSGQLQAIDVGVWALYEDRAGKSSVALMTAAEAARVLCMPDATRSVQRSVERLTKVGLLERTDKRGNFIVRNPAWRERAGNIDLSLTFVNKSPSSSQVPSTSPQGSVTPDASSPDEASPQTLPDSTKRHPSRFVGDSDVSEQSPGNQARRLRMIQGEAS